MFKKILIANRGEIACRVAATARRMAILTVAVYSDADANAKHVAACDEAVYIGGSAPKDSYLRWENILAAAKATGAEAIHPGYGFLSENAAFAIACEAAGLVFIGPSAAAMQAMGLKAESKRLMEAAGVPLIPGYHGSDQSLAGLQRESSRIGYPQLIKASAGGGGKGMRIVEKEDDFAASLASCQREAITSFGNDHVLIEKYAQRPRHIEIQVFGDMHGNFVHLFERDCSVQRRHQKVLEEAPAPGLSAAMRQQMGEAAVSAARAVNYVGAGTVEFIVEQPGDGSMPFFFMEMNTRLQVEHPVTEAITGLDLVEWQLRIANGEPLPLQQSELRINGHAIEARICAENPDNGFLPATGTLAVYQKPVCRSFERAPDGIRIDDGVREGDAISPFYDSMIAKVVVHGASRAEALARLDAALTQTRIVGLATNVQFLRHVLASPSFAHARLDTALIEREKAVLFHQQPVSLALAAAAVIGQVLQREKAGENAGDPFSRRDGWQAYGMTERLFALEFAEQAVLARLQYQRDGSLWLALEPAPPDARDDADPVSVAATGTAGVLVVGLAASSLGAAGGVSFKSKAKAIANTTITSTALDIAYAGQRSRLEVVLDSATGRAHVFTPAGAAQIVLTDRLAHAGASPADTGRLTAPMPGKVVSFAVKAGDAVSKGQPLAVMEAMKMEHTIAAPKDGRVAALLYAPGDQVAEGAELLTLAA